jgi:hypothetical protein
MGMSDETMSIREMFHLKAVEADKLTGELQKMLAGRSTVACVMSMGAVLGSMLREQDENTRAEYSTMLAAAILMQLEATPAPVH